MRLRIQDFDYENTDISHLIAEHIHNKRNRDILLDRFVDGLTYDEIASKEQISYEQVKKIIYKCEKILLPHILKRSK